MDRHNRQGNSGKDRQPTSVPGTAPNDVENEGVAAQRGEVESEDTTRAETRRGEVNRDAPAGRGSKTATEALQDRGSGPRESLINRSRSGGMENRPDDLSDPMSNRNA